MYSNFREFGPISVGHTVIDSFSCYVHEMRKINAFIETYQPSELHKSIMGLLQISIVSLFVLFLETSSQFGPQFNNGVWNREVG